MKTEAGNIILLTLAAATVAAVTALYACGTSRRSAMECRDVKVTVKDSCVNRFVSENEVKKLLAANCGGVQGVFADSLDLERIETTLKGKSVIRDCEAYVTSDGTLHIDVTQRTPAVRFQNASNGWYADTEGYVFPLQRSYTSMVQVVDGDFPVTVERGFKGQVEDPQQREWLMKVVALTEYAGKGGWKNRFSQFHVNRGGEITLVPADGDEVFIFGQPDGIERKFAKMERYYRMIRPLGKNYREVDVRFSGQIVCR